MAQGSPIAVLATLPPPVNGLHLATRLTVESLAQASPVLLYDWSGGPRFTGFSWRVVKGLRSLLSPLKLVQWKRHQPISLYTVANANGGLYYNVLTIAVARALRYRCVLHHHTYIYLSSADWRMRIISRLLGPNDTHVVLAPEMEKRFREVYGGKSQFFVLPNNYVMETLSRSTIEALSAVGRRFFLGHISNLSLGKGLQHVIDTFELLCATHDVGLSLAGPLMGKAEQALVDELTRRHPDRVTYHGAVHGEVKEHFFRDIDALLFPSELEEAQPLVILEAFAFGVPTIAYGRGCIQSLVGTDGGHVVPVDTDYAPVAHGVIQRWLDDPAIYDQACRMVRNKADRLRKESSRQLAEFHRHVSDQSTGQCHDTKLKTGNPQ